MSIKMEHLGPAHQGHDDSSYSRRSRSRANSGVSSNVSSADGHFYNLTLANSPRSLQFDLSRPPSSTGIHSSSYIPPAPPNPAAFLSTPSTQTYNTFTPLSPCMLGAAWSEGQPHHAPSVRIDAAQEYSPPSSSPLPSTCNAKMSAMAVPFDTRFDLGVHRDSFSNWPVLDSGADLLGHDLCSVGHGSDMSLTPPPSEGRSMTSSPPRGMMMAEQRELKRQRDQARRDSKSSARARRAFSNTSYASQSPPVSMSEFSSASSLPMYTTSPSEMSLLSQPVTAGSDYLSSYSTPPLPEQAMFSAPFSTMPSHGYMGLDYSSPFPQQGPSQNINAHFRQHASPMPEAGMMYSMPAVMEADGGMGEGHVRVVQSRPKPQCWEHGCNGRQFSTFSNLLRHQREKSGQAAKASCPNCGAEFTRTTARNGHLAHDKCKQRRNS